MRWVLGIGFLVATGVIYTTASDLNLLLNGEKEAMHLGVDVRRVRLVVYIAASLLTGLAVSVSGAIGYVGLLVPHVMRLIFGSDHRILIPTSAFGGAIVRGHRRHPRAHRRRPLRAARRRHDRARGRTVVHLFTAAQIRVSSSRTMAASSTFADNSRASDIRLSVEQVSYAYSANPSQAPLFTLEASSFQARPGEIVAILGPNASGKSTLLKLIAGAQQPLSGRVLLNGFVTHSLTPRIRAQRIAMVQQESPLLFPISRLGICPPGPPSLQPHVAL